MKYFYIEIYGLLVVCCFCCATAFDRIANRYLYAFPKSTPPLVTPREQCFKLIARFLTSLAVAALLTSIVYAIEILRYR